MWDQHLRQQIDLGDDDFTLHAVPPLTNVNAGKHDRIKKRCQRGAFAQLAFQVELKHLAGAPTRAQTVRRKGLDGHQFREEIITHSW